MNWLLRIGDGRNFENSTKFNIWGFQGNTTSGKCFIKNVKKGDKLWFIINGKAGLAQVNAVATFESFNPRNDKTLSDNDLGWANADKYDYEIRYSNLFNVFSSNLYTGITCRTVISRANHNCKLNLDEEYSKILVRS